MTSVPPKRPIGTWSGPRWNRKLHRILAAITALPLVIVLGSGVFLQLKKHWSYVQPPTQRGDASVPTLSFARLLEVLAHPDLPGPAQARSWDDVDRLDVRPSGGLIKVQLHSGYEVQIDSVSGKVLQVAERRSDLIESLHDGSFFGDWAKLGIFLPCAFLALGLWFTGVYLWWLPYAMRRRRRRTEGRT